MAVTYNAPNYSEKYPVPGPSGNSVLVLLDATVTLAAAPTTADTINFGYLPGNAVVTGGYLKASDMDTGESPSLTLDVGVSGTAQLFFAASTAGQAGVASDGLAAAGILYANPTGTKLGVVGTAHANAATGAAGTAQLVLTGYIKEPTTSGN